MKLRKPCWWGLRPLSCSGRPTSLECTLLRHCSFTTLWPCLSQFFVWNTNNLDIVLRGAHSPEAQGHVTSLILGRSTWSRGTLTSSWQTSSVRGQMVSILVFSLYMISVATTLLYCFRQCANGWVWRDSNKTYYYSVHQNRLQTGFASSWSWPSTSVRHRASPYSEDTADRTWGAGSGRRPVTEGGRYILRKYRDIPSWWNSREEFVNAIEQWGLNSSSGVPIKNEEQCLVTFVGLWSHYVPHSGNLLCPFTRKPEQQPCDPMVNAFKNGAHVRLVCTWMQDASSCVRMEMAVGLIKVASDWPQRQPACLPLWVP